MALPYDFLQELRLRNSIEDVVADYVNLRRTGSKLFGLCPFHGEKTPSFNVVPEDGYFYCFGCGAGGDVISFIMKIENLDYIEAVRFLAQRCGMEMPENSADAGLSDLRKRIYEMNREAGRYYYRQLYTNQGKPALEYLRGRALTENTIRRFGLGYSPPDGHSLTEHLKSLGYKENEIIQANLAVKSSYGKAKDRFFDRVMFPIIDLRGNVIAFGGRLMGDGKPKYLNTSDTLVFKKSTNLFALNFAKNVQGRQLILAEGYMDVIALNQAGFENAVATLGTALTQEQAMLMKRYADEVIICYDADEAGQKAASRAIGILRGADLLIKVLTIPGAKDPDEFLRSNGEQGYARFKQLLNGSGNDIEYRLGKIKKEFNMESTEEKVQYLTQAAKLLSELENNIERDIYAGKISDETGVQKDAVLAQINKYVRISGKDKRKKEFRKIQSETSAGADRINPDKRSNLRAAKAEEALIAFILKNPESAKKIRELLPPESLVTDFNKRVYSAVTDKILSGQSFGLSDLSEQFRPEEISVIAGFKAKYNIESTNRQAAKEYINVILSEKDKLSIKDAENLDDEDIAGYLEKLKNLKK